MPSVFGTDGIRGPVDTVVTVDLARSLGRAAGQVLEPGRFLVGRDTRESGPRLQDGLTEGLVETGCEVVDLGVAPTPAVAYMATELGAPAAVISASHNPYPDNGIKLFGPDGYKIDDADQARVEELLDRTDGGTTSVAGSRTLHEDPLGRYEQRLAEIVGDLTGLRIVLDCANGAAYEVAPRVIRRAGAEVTALFDRPDGRNINAGCGSTHPAVLRSAVAEHGADLGIGLDGDADRMLAVDAEGELVDGDQIMALIALDRHATGSLPGDAVVVTTMSNLGFRRAMERAGIAVVVTPVGDRHVIQAMRIGGYGLGGEQSGHIIFGDVSTTGDGLLAGMVLAELVRRRGVPLSEQVAAAMTKLPQVLVNVTVEDTARTEAELAPLVADVEAELGHDGRVLVRASGTEPVIRIMVEAPTEERATEAAARLADAVARPAGSGRHG